MAKNYKESYLNKQIHETVNLVYGNINNTELLLSLLMKNEVVIHLASETGTVQSMYRLKRYTEVNIGFVTVLMDTLINNKTNIKKVLLGSSRAVYGEGKYIDEQGCHIYPNLRSKTKSRRTQSHWSGSQTSKF